jgi:anti-sigma factor RsiW
VADRERIRAGASAPSTLRLLATGWNPAVIAAALLLAVVAGATITAALIAPPPRKDAVEQQVLASHIRSLMPGHLTDMQSADRRAVQSWFEGRLDAVPPVVDLAGDGFALVGGRLDYVDGHPAAALVYRRAQHVINVLVWPGASPPATAGPPAASTLRGYNLLRFAGRGLVLWVVSDLNAAELRGFAGRLAAAVGADG